MAGRTGTTRAIGVPYDDGPAGFEVSDQVYQAIERGDHDEVLDRLERMIKQRVAFDRRSPGSARTARTDWTEIERQGLVSQVQHGYFGRHTSMLGEAVRNRKVQLKNADLIATLDRLKANPPTLAEGDRVRVHPDAPLKQKWTVLLGRTATVTGKPVRGKVTIRFDDGQPLGPLTNPNTKMDVWMLEKLDGDVLDPATMKAVLAQWEKATSQPGPVKVFDAWLRENQA